MLKRLLDYRRHILVVALLALGHAEPALAQWQALAPDVHSDRTVVVDPLIPTHLYLPTDIGLFKSEDGGNSWTRLASLPTARVTSVAVSASSRGGRFGSPPA